MCGIFGIYASANYQIPKTQYVESIRRLFEESSSRGSESSGLHMYLPELRRCWTLKANILPSLFIDTEDFCRIIDSFLDLSYDESKHCFKYDAIFIGHARMVTNGTAANPKNNQPCNHGHTTVVHNGIIVNTDLIWPLISQRQPSTDLDTEALSALLNSYLDAGKSSTISTQSTFSKLKGSASIAWVSSSTNSLTLATNTGDLFYSLQEESNKALLYFASQNTFLSQIADCKHHEILQIKAREAISIAAGHTYKYSLSSISAISEFDEQRYESQNVYHQSTYAVSSSPSVSTLISNPPAKTRYNKDSLLQLKRCSRCILPETFPYITFDPDGVCNYCHNYKSKYPSTNSQELSSSFLYLIDTYKRANGAEDVLIPFSGGRDSCYALHLVKNELGFNPVTFTYDWGMVTDLARRNISRMCSQLGVRNILISANIQQKRKNIQRNVSAWLKNPSLGMIPLFMAGDKHFFSIVNQIKRETSIRLDLWAANPLENTDFKSGFCGVSPDFSKSRLDYLSNSRKIKMALYYMKNFATNPSYLNTSLVDTVGAFKSYYIEPRNDFFFMFHHLYWNENIVNSTIIDNYEFELSPDSPSTWRIGDGTAPFYNYIYVTSRGFSEFDTFRSNQIREGHITREEALDSVLEENYPREESLRWYLDAIKLDYCNTIECINKMDTLGLHTHA